jgi:uncharacterized damage-inducible protein DinB
VGDSPGLVDMNKEMLLEQFTACYDENGWFVALKNAINGISAEQAAWKPDGADNSIWEMLSHLNYYNFAYLQRFKGFDYKYTKSDNDETFEAAEGASDSDWKLEIERFDAIMTELRDLLTAADDGRLNEDVSEKNQSPWWTVIAHMNIHNAHHGGQIVLLRKLQGSWNPEQGVS